MTYIILSSSVKLASNYSVMIYDLTKLTFYGTKNCSQDTVLTLHICRSIHGKFSS